jgi:hypothetical protein
MTQHHIPQERNYHSHRCHSLSSLILMSVWQFVFLVLNFYILSHPACYNSKLTSETIDLFGNAIEGFEWAISPTQEQYKGR